MIDNNETKRPVPQSLYLEDLDDCGIAIIHMFTQDELDYELKRQLKHTTPEEDRKETYLPNPHLSLLFLICVQDLVYLIITHCTGVVYCQNPYTLLVLLCDYRANNKKA
jgi:hypothetical protein